MRILLKNKTVITLLIGFTFTGIPGCKKFIDIDPPTTTTNAANVYKDDATAAAVLTGIYTTMASEENGNVGIGALNIAPSLSADELTLLPGSFPVDIVGYYTNQLNSNIYYLPLSSFWSKYYGTIFIANSAIEGLNNSQTLTPSVKTRLLGEAYFVRAFFYFYLVNLFGDVPLVLTTNYKENSLLARTDTAAVYAQIKQDLLAAQSMLTDGYLDGSVLAGTTERVRPNKYVATAMLARVLLYMEEWEEAEIQASAVISNSSVYIMEPSDKVFVKESAETIWALQPTGVQTEANTGAGKVFIIPQTGPSFENYVSLNEGLKTSFDGDDLRLANWIGSVTAAGVTYYYANKYKVPGIPSPTLEYPVILRLAEQYLIRAEARAHLNNLTGANSAQSDIDIIRNRAGLTATIATSQNDLLGAIATERKHELFTEYGHRWFDLKRTKAVDEIMETAAANKGGSWQDTDALYPIPQREINNNPKLIQNNGY